MLVKIHWPSSATLMPPIWIFYKRGVFLICLALPRFETFCNWIFSPAAFLAFGLASTDPSAETRLTLVKLRGSSEFKFQTASQHFNNRDTNFSNLFKTASATSSRPPTKCHPKREHKSNKHETKHPTSMLHSKHLNANGGWEARHQNLLARRSTGLFPTLNTCR